MRGRWDVGFASYGRWYSKDGVELRCRQCGAVNRSDDVAKEAPVCAQCGAALRVLKYMTAWGRVLIGIAFFAAITAIFVLREGG